MYSFQRTSPGRPEPFRPGPARKITPQVVGLTGVEPVTLRLSSACSNQLSYRPGGGFEGRPLGPKSGGAEEIRTPDL